MPSTTLITPPKKVQCAFFFFISQRTNIHLLDIVGFILAKQWLSHVAFVSGGTFCTRRRWKVGESDTPPGEQKHSPECARVSVSCCGEKILHDPKHVLLYVTWPTGAAAYTGASGLRHWRRLCMCVPNTTGGGRGSEGGNSRRQMTLQLDDPHNACSGEMHYQCQASFVCPLFCSPPTFSGDAAELLYFNKK